MKRQTDACKSRFNLTPSRQSELQLPADAKDLQTSFYLSHMLAVALRYPQLGYAPKIERQPEGCLKDRDHTYAGLGRASRNPTPGHSGDSACCVPAMSTERQVC